MTPTRRHQAMRRLGQIRPKGCAANHVACEGSPWRVPGSGADTLLSGVGWGVEPHRRSARLLPAIIVSDNGMELTSHAILALSGAAIGAMRAQSIGRYASRDLLRAAPLSRK